MGSSVLQTYVVCTSVLYLKFLRVTMIQAKKTFEAGGRAPEDKNLPLAKGRPKQTYGMDPEAEKDEKILKAREVEHRWRRIVQNDLESIPLALVVFGIGVAIEHRINPTVQIGAMATYTALRCFHTIAYAKKLQPHRAWCWRLGVVAIVAGAVNAVVGVYAAYSSDRPTMSGSTELKAYVVCSLILYLKFVIATGIQATKTFDAGCRPPEDKNLALAQGRREQNYGLFNDINDAELMKAREIEHRWKRIIQNDLESIPLALLVFIGGVFAGGNKELYVVCLAIYTCVRCFHTYAHSTFHLGTTSFTAMSASTELKTYVTCAAVLYVKFVLATGIQATKTFEAGGRPPEDKKLPLAKGNPVQTYGLVTPPETSKEESEKLQKAKVTELRWRRIVQNDLESIPLALVVFGAGVMAKGNPAVLIGAMVGYTAVRCFHTVAYANAMHPHRALCWLFGVIFITTGAGNALYGAFSS
ncbi:unnamed protein product [Phytophthora fragariaefolia]|uniref:Microsomal glutathione S-transferase 1 n=1 Tax=Phytophthora fragariaefolia TaxID=1490495 RepID=A0A9W6Y485_9STRA|nr:unnamed protein product [Phytophthora fragariaefolia]